MSLQEQYDKALQNKVTEKSLIVPFPGSKGWQIDCAQGRIYHGAYPYRHEIQLVRTEFTDGHIDDRFVVVNKTVPNELVGLFYSASLHKFLVSCNLRPGCTKESGKLVPLVSPVEFAGSENHIDISWKWKVDPSGDAEGLFDALILQDGGMQCGVATHFFLQKWSTDSEHKHHEKFADTGEITDFARAGLVNANLLQSFGLWYLMENSTTKCATRHVYDFFQHPSRIKDVRPIALSANNRGWHLAEDGRFRCDEQNMFEVVLVQSIASEEGVHDFTLEFPMIMPVSPHKHHGVIALVYAKKEGTFLVQAREETGNKFSPGRMLVYPSEQTSMEKLVKFPEKVPLSNFLTCTSKIEAPVMQDGTSLFQKTNLYRVVDVRSEKDVDISQQSRHFWCNTVDLMVFARMGLLNNQFLQCLGLHHLAEAY